MLISIAYPTGNFEGAASPFCLCIFYLLMVRRPDPRFEADLTMWNSSQACIAHLARRLQSLSCAQVQTGWMKTRMHAGFMPGCALRCASDRSCARPAGRARDEKEFWPCRLWTSAGRSQNHSRSGASLTLAGQAAKRDALCGMGDTF